MTTDAELWTVDIDQDGSAIAKAHLDRRARVIVENALSFMQGVRSLGRRFDLIFADAMPGKYQHRDLALDLLVEGGLYIVDDLSPSRGWREGAALAAELARDISADPRLVSLSLDWSTGHLIAVRVG
jgi:predicted O-methyltransferase YrrM